MEESVLSFILAVLPLLVILAGIALFNQSGLRMAFVGWLATVLLACTYFRTPVDVAAIGTIMGFLKSFPISIAVVFTMLMIYVMQSVGALSVISDSIKNAVHGAENQALYIGIGFGSFLTSLGVVTPALFPPLLVVMGFTPFAAVAIAVLGYNATTSFALLSIPITLPAEVFNFDPIAFAYRISLFLPLISVGLSYGVLWMVGGRAAMRRGTGAALVVGLAVAAACLLFTGIDHYTGVEYIPLRVVGPFAGLLGMACLQIYQRLRSPGGQTGAAPPPGSGSAKPRAERSMGLARAASPWIILTVLAVITSIPAVKTPLANLLGSAEVVTFYNNQTVDFDLPVQIYTLILLAVLLSLFTLRPTREQMSSSVRLWARRAWGPFLAYSVYFCIAYVMLFSAQHDVNGTLTPMDVYRQLNMNVVVGTTLARIFGAGYIFVAAALGLFGAVVGGSETSSNVMFYQIQKEATSSLGLSGAQFLSVYSSHAVAGGVASAITPAKLNNAVATIDAGVDVESQVMRKHLLLAILLTVVTGVLCALFVNTGF
jgi:lactate permease